ncbi:stage III sporulation protein AF [Clostridium sp. JN-9]|uniref:stage III sporulation protein AF n=1 Tax=Clostridium sp. JN-9 TaxID=2507159 RepID=UPI000FFE2145|nr:stage III sporulation protein AF [Clostridium sp. JN-9]QAT40053.1 stage III sporulation protein AF [Clostridium sp. JN-9]
MMQQLKDWVINICIVVFFVTAVEMILPDNKMKKYAKLVLGLIIISVLMKPIIKIFDKNYNIDAYASRAAETLSKGNYSEDFTKYEKSNISSTIENFNSNLKTLCEKTLKEKMPQYSYDVQAKTDYNKENNKFEIKEIKVAVQDGKVQKIKKIVINDASKYVNTDKGNVSEETANLIKKYLSEELKVPASIIKVYKP